MSEEVCSRERSEQWGRQTGVCAVPVPAVGPKSLVAGGSFWNTQADLDHRVHPLRRPWCPGGAQPMLTKCAAKGQAWRRAGVLRMKGAEK